MKIFIIFNPIAGGSRRFKRLAQLEKYLRLSGNTVTTYTSSHAGEGTELTLRALDGGAEVVVVVGGDGTVNEVIQGLAGSSAPMAVYPAGTTNVWCQQIKMPHNPRLAAEIITSSPRISIDLGQVGSRYFLLMLGIGLDGEVVRAVDLDLKRKIGKLAYLKTGLRALFQIQATDISIIFDPGQETEHSKHFSSCLIIATNVQRYAVVRLLPSAIVDDGKLDLLVFEGSKLRSKIARLLSLITNRIQQDEKIGYFRISSANIQCNSPMATQIDGDPFESASFNAVEIKCIPKALRVIIPPKAPRSFFSDI